MRNDREPWAGRGIQEGGREEPYHGKGLCRGEEWGGEWEDESRTLPPT